MAYTALYRKFRPNTFKGVVGQEHIVKTLKNEILSDMVSHAYLFCGTRGTGKTSTAKIFAKAINCLNPKDGEPCGQCEMCAAIQEGRSVNVIEIDAASNNGVENIRDIREEVKYPPTEGKYKVYIIDEVHMLSPGAFNALLKTLEEPPKHVIFILATTDPQRVPVTILSRCQRFDFKRISSGEITQTLKKYLKEEGADADDAALSAIGRLADGSMRDSLSILDQCLAFYHGEKITEENVLEVCGNTDVSVFFDMTEAVVSKNAAKAMDIIDDTINKGRDISQFITDFLEHLRNLLVCSSVDEAETLIDTSEENAKRLKKQSEKLSPEEIIYLIKVFSGVLSDIKYSSNKRIILEVEIIKLCSNTVKNDVDYLASRLAQLERTIKNGVVAVSVNDDLSKKGESAENTEKPKPKDKAFPEDISKIRENWRAICSKLPVNDKTFFDLSEAGYMEDGRLTIVCPNGYKSFIESKKQDFLDVLLSMFNKIFDIKIVEKSEYENYESVNGGHYDNVNEDDPFFNSTTGMFSDADFIDE